MITGSQARATWDVVVVGAGHNGLTAAAMLARAGLPRWWWSAAT